MHVGEAVKSTYGWIYVPFSYLFVLNFECKHMADDWITVFLFLSAVEQQITIPKQSIIRREKKKSSSHLS